MMNKRQSVIDLIVFLCLYGSEKLYLRSKIKRPVVFSCLSLSEIVIGPMKLQSYVNLRMFSRVVLRLAETSLFRLPYKRQRTKHCHRKKIFAQWSIPRKNRNIIETKPNFLPGENEIHWNLTMVVDISLLCVVKTFDYRTNPVILSQIFRYFLT